MDLRKGLLKKGVPLGVVQNNNVENYVDEDDEKNNEETQNSASSSPSSSSPSPFVFAAPQNQDLEKFSPLSWESYFDEYKDISIPNTSKFRVYQSFGVGGKELNGEKINIIALHGAGHSSLSWALVAKCLKNSNYDFMAIDMRGHGNSIFEEEEENFALSEENLVKDVVDVINHFFIPNPIPRLLLVGHSMGGAIAAKVAYGYKNHYLRDDPNEVKEKWQIEWDKLLEQMKGLVVIDMVETTAIDAIPAMTELIQNRPQSFPSLAVAIRWSIRSKLIRNAESARVSIPPLLTPKNNNNNNNDNNDDGDNDNSFINKHSPLVWKLDLLKTTKYWKGWFNNMTLKFLNCKVQKLLILAGSDRLDTDLTVAQMQGRYQLILLPSCGHTIQEDAPETIAAGLVRFIERVNTVITFKPE